jgi:hypothetical protein
MNATWLNGFMATTSHTPYQVLAVMREFQGIIQHLVDDFQGEESACGSQHKAEK